MNLSEMNPHQTKIIPLIGSPIGGFISPHVHNYLFDLYKVNAMNLPVEIRKRELAGFIEVTKLMNFSGFILTMPNKVDIIPLVDEIDEV
ncbi:hypothetical protein [Petroclostridium sp. X23]|uniref:hypothetical protein n=1 Tax=Petroclostridium sp. X23 TaxID=3045146 RepID=UPI0024ACF495|nr:hypothetical protein [Petroclostridium sp. X23]WHH57785.1 hypothetical protein QKW49_18465 [Petroclostridium sp. X23]